ncbi:hypothetical protein RCL_jg26764.t1 [Rhizophagus clarus]|uniref:Uncharacterized protein n=1 Tax=Rhizophagus clarus TaxID=94130 RepID=A0A8H3QNF9_9GLOM|nr:hypothetical protein RCL_jg26764.t1 [Rhizophagus clarus]
MFDELVLKKNDELVLKKKVELVLKKEDELVLKKEDELVLKTEDELVPKKEDEPLILEKEKRRISIKEWLENPENNYKIKKIILIIVTILAGVNIDALEILGTNLRPSGIKLNIELSEKSKKISLIGTIVVINFSYLAAFCLSLTAIFMLKNLIKSFKEIKEIKSKKEERKRLEKL